MTSSGSAVRVVLADDHRLVLEGLRAVLATASDIVVVAAVGDGVEALDAVRRLLPQVLVVDLQMPPSGGIECLHAVRTERLPVRVVVLSAFGDASAMRAAVEGGADGFVLKTSSPIATITAIRQVASGQLVFPQAARRWLAAGSRKPALDALTAREEEVLALVAEGRSNGEIGRALGLRGSTVKFHLRNLFVKLGVANRTEAALRFHRR